MSNQAVTTLRNLRVYTTYTLKYPVDLPDGTRLTEINLRRMKGADQEAFENQRFDFEKDSYKITKFFIARLSTLVPEDINEIDGADITALSKLITELVTEGKSEVSES